MNNTYIPSTTLYKKYKYHNLYKAKVVVVKNNEISSITGNETYKDQKLALKNAIELIKKLSKDL